MVFLPSYKMLDRVKNLWEEKGILSSILNKKKVRTSYRGLLRSYRHDLRDAGLRGVNSRRPRFASSLYGRNSKWGKSP